MIEWNGKRYWLVGASEGLGAAVAQKLSRVGVNLVLSARSEDKLKDLAEAHAFPFPYLHDESQQVAQAYGAVCTPDFFGYNKNLELQYRGRLDDAGKNPAGPDTTRDLLDAMGQIARTGEGPREQIPSMGCSIKWKAA